MLHLQQLGILLQETQNVRIECSQVLLVLRALLAQGGRLCQEGIVLALSATPCEMVNAESAGSVVNMLRDRCAC